MGDLTELLSMKNTVSSVWNVWTLQNWKERNIVGNRCKRVLDSMVAIGGQWWLTKRIQESRYNYIIHSTSWLYYLHFYVYMPHQLTVKPIISIQHNYVSNANMSWYRNNKIIPQNFPTQRFSTFPEFDMPRRFLENKIYYFSTKSNMSDIECIFILHIINNNTASQTPQA